jgi:NTP pyrophosphatase (non-canonical NTP hydrolase)
MQSLDEMKHYLRRFARERDWEQFHNPKDLAVALSIESGELLEAFLWKDAEEAKIEKVKEELADVLAYAILLGHHYSLDLEQVVRDKVQKNGEKYPVEKAKGRSDKYTEL